MKRLVISLILLLAAFAPKPCLAEDALEGLTPAQILAQARTMFPLERIEVTGRLETAEARGMNATVRPYSLVLDWAGGVPKADCRLFRTKQDGDPIVRAELSRVDGKPALALFDSQGNRTDGARLNLPIGESDLTWMDLAFDYLWWPDARRLSEADLAAAKLDSRVSGRNCAVLEVDAPVPVPGLGGVRIWVDRATGGLLQTQQLDETRRPVRLMWVQRVGREEGRWVPRLFRIRRSGMRRETSLRVDTVRAKDFSVEKEEDHD